MSTTFKWLFFVGIVILGSCIMYPLFWYFSPHATFRESILHGLWIPPIHFALITWLCLKMFRAGIKFVDTLFVGAGAFLILFPAGVLSMLPFSIFDMPTYTQLSLLLSIGFLEIVAFYVIVVWWSIIWFLWVYTLWLSALSSLSRTKIAISVVCPFLIFLALQIVHPISL